MSTTSIVPDIKKFVHFGCWNNLNKKSCLESVMTTLNEYLHNNVVEFLIVAGDNYYPHKDEQRIDGVKVKTKIIYTELLLRGFHLLPNIPIYMILGNHDLETTKKKKNLFINDVGTPEEGDCFIAKQELHSYSMKPNIDFNLFKHIKVNDNTLCLMIDTSMYTTDINDYLKCYNVFLNSKGIGPFETGNALMEYQIHQIVSAITDNIDGLKYIIISGHHPIIGVKYDEGKQLEILNDIPFFKEVLQIINGIAKNVKYYYLCADLHLYQKGTINLKFNDAEDVMTINQYIVGTGGTKLDDELPANLMNNTYHNDDETIDYLLEDCKRECGFLECILTNDGDTDPAFIFIPANDKMGGKKLTRRKYKKRKYKKYNTRKRMRNITRNKKFLN